MTPLQPRYVRVLKEYRHPLDRIMYGPPREYISEKTFTSNQ